MRVLEASQAEVLVAQERRKLNHDRAVGQRSLRSQEDTTVPPMA